MATKIVRFDCAYSMKQLRRLQNQDLANYHYYGMASCTYYLYRKRTNIGGDVMKLVLMLLGSFILGGNGGTRWMRSSIIIFGGTGGASFTLGSIDLGGNGGGSSFLTDLEINPRGTSSVLNSMGSLPVVRVPCHGVK